MRNKRTSMIQAKSVPIALKTWLYASGSLTQQLTDVAGGVFKVQPIQEHYQRMAKIDSQWMSMPIQHTSWVRESFLYGCDDQPWVKAKSIFPILSIHGKARLFKHIGKQPIGRYLFQRTNPMCERRVLKLQDGWTRQSCYTWHGCRFIVQETFLPAFEYYLQQQKISK